MSTLKFVQTAEVTLYSPLGAADTTARIAPYPVDLDGNKLSYSDFGDNPCVTFDPGVASYEEIGAFTGIVDNGDNTGTLTGLSRDLTGKSPYTTTGTGKQHGASAVVVFSNNPQMYARLASLENTQTFTGVNTFSQSPVVPDPTTAMQAANKEYVDNTAVAGAPNASTTTKGIVEEGTQAEIDAKTAAGGTAARLFVNPSTLRSTLLSDYVAETGVVATMTIATPAVATFNSHGLSANDNIAFATTGALPTGVTAGTIYYVIATGLTANAFQFSATLGGAAINSSGSQNGVHSLFRSNTYVITPSPALTSYSAGKAYSFKATCPSTGTSTVNANGLGARTIKKLASTNIAANDILAGMNVDIEDDGTNAQMMNPVGTTVALANGAYPAGTGGNITGIRNAYDYQAFTASGTWTKPSGLVGTELVKVQLWGAGGGGGGAVGSGNQNNGGGGGGGAFVEAIFRASDLGSTVAVTIGAGGAGGSGAANGVAGGNTTFGSLLTSYGGGGGSQGNTGPSNGGGGGGGGQMGAGTTPSNSSTGGAGGSPLGAAAGATSTLGGGGGGTSANGGASAFGGGGGGGGGGAQSGGNSLYGGGGGGNGANSGTSPGGTGIIYGGTGGTGVVSGNGGSGTAPAGAGAGGSQQDIGASRTGGAGARGECRVWVNF